MIWPKTAPHHGWGAKKIFDYRTSKTAISILRRKGGVKTELLNRKIFLTISYIIYNYMFIYVSTSSAGH